MSPRIRSDHCHLPMFVAAVSAADNLSIGGILTAASLLRSFAL